MGRRTRLSLEGGPTDALNLAVVVTPLGGTCAAGTLTGTRHVTGAVTADCTVVAAFAANPADHLAFVAPPADVLQGEGLGAVQVAVVDADGNVVTGDSSSQISLSTAACGAPVSLGQTTASNGIASFPAETSVRFYTQVTGRSLDASSGSYAGSTTFNVVSGSDLLFSDGFDSCRL